MTNTACSVTDLGLRVAGGFSLTRGTTLERHFRDARGGLFQPPQDDLALGLLGRSALAARGHAVDVARGHAVDAARGAANEPARNDARKSAVKASTLDKEPAR